MSIKVRQSPSGPVVAELSNGAVTGKVQATITRSKFAMAQDTQVLLGPNPPSSAQQLAFNVKSSYGYQMKLSTMFDATDATGTSSLEVSLEYSNDGGSNWNDLANSAIDVPIDASPNRQAGLFRVDLANDIALGSALLPAQAEEGEVLFRAFAIWRGAATFLWAPGTAGTGSAPLGQTQLEVEETLQGV